MLIPKILHFIWVGGNPNPFVKNIETYKKFNPDWAIQLWTDGNLPKLQNKNIYNSIPVPTTKADLLRLEILYQYGGVYADIDSVCLKPLNKMVAGHEMFFASHTIKEKKVEINCIGVTAGHPAIKDLLDGLPEYWSELVESKKGKLSVYCLYTYLRKRIGECALLPLEYNCSKNYATENTFILQHNVHTFKDSVNANNKFRVI